MKIGLYINEFLYRIGGTESYTSHLADTLQNIYPDSNIFFVTELYSKNDLPSQENFIDRINKSYGTKLLNTKCHLLPIFCSKKNKFSVKIMFSKIQNSSKQFDLFFYCSRGNFIFKAKKNIAVIHFPTLSIIDQKKQQKKFDISFVTKFKDSQYCNKYDLFIPNSLYTEKWLKIIRTDIAISKIHTLYPPVQLFPNLKLERKNAILICSRIEKSKRIEDLITAYSNSDCLKNNYELWICGNIDKDMPNYSEELKQNSKDLNIKFFFNVNHSKLEVLYNTARFFWHAKGFGIDENKSPELLEHFGITTVEAMSAGCIPIVINKGGQTEIVIKDAGFKWNNLDELTAITEKLANFSDDILDQISKNAILRSTDFSIQSFTNKLKDLLCSY